MNIVEVEGLAREWASLARRDAGDRAIDKAFRRLIGDPEHFKSEYWHFMEIAEEALKTPRTEHLKGSHKPHKRKSEMYDLVQKRLSENVSQVSIAKELGVTKQRIGQIVKIIREGKE